MRCESFYLSNTDLLSVLFVAASCSVFMLLHTITASQGLKDSFLHAKRLKVNLSFILWNNFLYWELFLCNGVIWGFCHNCTIHRGHLRGGTCLWCENNAKTKASSNSKGSLLSLLLFYALCAVSRVCFQVRLLINNQVHLVFSLNKLTAAVVRGLWFEDSSPAASWEIVNLLLCVNNLTNMF